jgi:hypothetical protein
VPGLALGVLLGLKPAPARSDGVVDLAPEQWHQVPDAALTNRRAAVSILARQLTASVLLVKALGGGWEVSVQSSETKAESR